VLVLGGARSGKSTYAEGLLAGTEDVVYVATSGARPDDDEWSARVAQHRARRPATWTTVETTDLEPLLRSPGPPLLVDCLSLWLTAVLDDLGAWDPTRWAAVGRDGLDRRVDGLVEALAASPRRVVLVSNEVGSGVVPAHASGRLFRDELGRLNARVGAVVDEAVLLVAGRPLPLNAPARAAGRTAGVALRTGGGRAS
jgi:adenosylcobinamide kinase/adenosylcobinamide-phosphate guanylyltransferase